jgi:uncharacterized protein YbjT (DUF2867 family)
MTILITGATGNVGQAIIANFHFSGTHTLYLATRNKTAKKTDPQAGQLYFDFENLAGSLTSLKQTDIDILFLLRPPHISEVDKYFRPLIEACKQTSVQHIIFLSVQGADKASFIPHAKIEKLIVNSGIAYTFIRPSYFMQNLTTTLQKDIALHNRIFLPAGKAPFNWIDVNDIGVCIAHILENPEYHQNKIYTITGKENLNFEQAAAYLSQALGRKIEYISSNIVRFYFTKRREGMAASFILVMLLLHFVPRFQQEPQIHNDFEQLAGRQPKKLYDFVEENKAIWQQ